MYSLCLVIVVGALLINNVTVEVALVSPDGVALNQMVGVSASVNLPLHRKSPEVLFWHRLTRVVPKKGRKTVVVWCGSVIKY